jgi:hypothetical protein
MRRLFPDEAVSITLLRGMEGLESLRDAWSKILSGMTRRHFFHLWEWHYSYLKCLETNPNSLIYFLFMKEDSPIAIFPLQSTKTSLGGLRLKTLAFPSHNHIPLSDMICRREALQLPLFQLLVRHLRDEGKSWDMIRLHHVLDDACAIQITNNHPPPRFLIRQEGRCDFIDAAETYEVFLSGLSKNFRRSLKRAKQYLGELPGVQFAFTQNGPELEERFLAFMDVEASGWKGTSGSGTAIKLHPNLKCFYQTLIRTLCPSGNISVNTLSTDKKCIAAHFCILLDDTAYVLKIGYDEGYKRYAPGNLLIEFFIKKSIEGCSIKTINLITDAKWHEDWNPRSYNRSILYLFNATPAGLSGFIIQKSFLILKTHYQAYIKPHLSQATKPLFRH